MNKQFFYKAFTRDNSLIIQEVWDRGYIIDCTGRINKFLPTQINYITDGVVEIYDNANAVDWYGKQLLDKNKKDPEYFFEKMKEYQVIAKKVSEFRKKDRFENIKELKNFIKLLQQGTFGFLMFYHSAKHNETPNKIKEFSLDLRNKDRFYDDADRLIKNTIEYIFPHTKNLSISILTFELDNPPERHELVERFDNFVYIVDKKSEIIGLNEFLDKNLNFEIEKENVPVGNQLKGSVAYRGIVRGRVKILKRKNQINNFREGDILLSSETTPDFLPAMKKAGAIVTDEGGIMCHAAIVAREIKKACIIGTRFATKKFKDGDMVEVDAEKGIIRKLS